jgi:DNA modification methylase
MWFSGEELSLLLCSSAHQIDLPDKSVQVIATSPPYLGARHYQGDQEVEWPETSYQPMPNIDFEFTFPAWRGALGGEPSVEMFVGHLILCMREWWRILRDDGVVWVNLGDSFAGSGGAHKAHHRNPGISNSSARGGASVRHKLGQIKPKDKYLVPHRLALAAQAAGWWVRQEIVWAKAVSLSQTYSGRALPDSALDRPATTHEDIYLFAKSPSYYFDMRAVKEPCRESGGGRHLRSVFLVNPASDPTVKHTAIWPDRLVIPMVKASTSRYGACGACGAAYGRTVDDNGKTTGWEKRCACEEDKVEPCVVLDPFAGSSTTGRVAIAHGCRYVGVDISEVYQREVAVKRLADIQMQIAMEV